MNVTLIRSALVAPIGSVNNEPSPPLGMAYLSAYLKKCGHEVLLIDAVARGIEKIVKYGNDFQTIGLTIEEVIACIPQKVDVIGFSIMYTHEWIYVREAIHNVKKAFPNAVVIAGGEHITALPEFSLRDCASIDYCVIGEGERTAEELLRMLHKGTSSREVDGLAFLDSNKNCVITKTRRRLKNISQLPYPDWDSVPIDIYFEHNISHGSGYGRNIPFMASRGCPYQCTFCSNHRMWGKGYFIRSVDQVIEEISFYIDKYGISSIQFADLTAILKGDWIIEFSEKLKIKFPNIVWSLPSGTRSEALDKKVLEEMASSGLKYLVYAPESGSNSTLRQIKKKVSLEKMTKSIKHAVRIGIPVRSNFIIGFPNETRLDILKTIRQALYYAVLGVEEVPLFPFQPYPGTELFDYLHKKMNLPLNDEYFLSLISLSTGNLRVPRRSYNSKIHHTELYFYRIATLCLTYGISYLFHPLRIARFIKNFNSENSATVFEGRLKLLIKKILYQNPK